MALAAFPASLTQLLRQGFTAAQQDNATRFTPDVGPGLARRRSTSASVVTSVPLRLETKAQRDAFLDFFESTLQSGVLQFTMEDPVREVSYVWQFAGPYQNLSPVTDVVWDVVMPLYRVRAA